MKRDASLRRPRAVTAARCGPVPPAPCAGAFLAGSPLPGHAEQVRPGALKFTPKMPASALTPLSDADRVELPDGHQVRMGDVRRLKEAARKMRARKGAPLPAGLRTKPAPTGTPVRNASDLADALKRPDTDTVVLPSGRKVTVGMIRLLQPQVEKRTGRPIAAGPKRPNLSGSAVKVGAKTDWKDVLQRPDGTVLEAPDGTRITVGELKKSLAGGRP